MYKTSKNVEKQFQENVLYRRSLAAQQLFEELKNRKLFSHVQCDIGVAENLRPKFANFPPILKTSSATRNVFGDLMKTYAEKEGILSHRQKMLISGFTLQDGTLITPLLLFCLHLGLFCTKIHRLVEYPP